MTMNNTQSKDRKIIGSCHCMGPIPEGFTTPCERYIPVHDELTGADTNECEDCGHQEQCHV